MSLKNKHIICIGGPTGIGKTTLSILLAQKYMTPILSTDSRQFFREMNIGTAKPSKEELASAKHYFINNLSIHDNYNVGIYEKDVLDLSMELFKSHDLLISIGGSGLYHQALCEGFDEFPEISKEIRSELIDDLERLGSEKLLVELKEKDPVYFDLVDKKNPRRIIRALEVIRTSGKAYSDFLNKRKGRPFQCINIFLNEDRKTLYEKINSRVENMIKQGLEEEARSLYEYRTLLSLQTVGYRELFMYFDGDISYEKSIELIKRNSRRYAKRQCTWFKNKKWANFRPNQIEEIIQYIEMSRQ